MGKDAFQVASIKMKYSFMNGLHGKKKYYKQTLVTYDSQVTQGEYSISSKLAMSLPVSETARACATTGCNR